MSQTDITPRFYESIVFPDIDAATLAREDEKTSTPQGAWETYLRKFLPSAPQKRAHAPMRVVRF